MTKLRLLSFVTWLGPCQGLRHQLGETENLLAQATTLPIYHSHTWTSDMCPWVILHWDITEMGQL
jgi:hypothetical protein